MTPPQHRRTGWLATLLLVGVLPASAEAQRIVAEVREGGAGSAVADAVVLVISVAGDTVARALTAADGRAVFDVPAPGRYTVAAGVPGRGAGTAQVNAGRRQRVLVTITLSPAPFALEPLGVSVQRRPQWQVDHPWWQWPLRERQEWFGRLGMGRFYMEDQLRAYVNIRALLAHGVRTRPMNLNSSCEGGRDGWAYYLDGVPIQMSALDYIHPHDLFAAEVYTGANNLPGELAGISRPCGAVVLWRKRDF
jgi:hypothetical protein